MTLKNESSQKPKETKRDPRIRTLVAMTVVILMAVSGGFLQVGKMTGRASGGQGGCGGGVSTPGDQSSPAKLGTQKQALENPCSSYTWCIKDKKALVFPYSVLLGYYASREDFHDWYHAPNGGVNASIQAYNVFVGERAGYNQMSSSYITLVGMNSGYSMTSGDYNTYFGYKSGYDTTTGHHNVFLGSQSGTNTTTGAKNTFLGYKSGYLNATGSENTCIGRYSGFDLSSGTRNAFIGAYAGKNTTTGSDNTFTGYKSGYNNTTVGSNTFTGYKSGYSNTTGPYNTFTGEESGYSNTTGGRNTFTGRYSGQKNTTGEKNTFTGSSSGRCIRSSHNTYVGYASGNGPCGNAAGATGTQNTGVGSHTGENITTGTMNVFLGSYAGNKTTTGSNNLYIGKDAGKNATTGSGRVFIGYQVGISSNASNLLKIHNASGTPLIAGNFSSNSVTVNGTLTQTSDGRLKTNVKTLKDSLSKVMKLRGVSYHWKKMKGNPFPKGQQIGLIAQEVAKVVPEVVITNSNGYKAVSYANLVALLIEDVKQRQQKLSAEEKRVKKLRKIMSDERQKAMALQKQILSLKALVLQKQQVR